MRLRTLASATALALGLPLVSFAAGDDLVEQADRSTSKKNAATKAAAKQQLSGDNTVSYGPHMSIGGFYQNNDNSFGELDTFIPVWQNATNLAFLDFRGLDRSGPGLEGNFGGGYRQLFANEQWLWGAYGFYDIANSQYNNTFSQITVGGELKNDTWAFLANGYVPIGKTSYNLNPTGIVDSQLRAGGANGFDNLYYSDSAEQAMGGFDAEVGFSIPGLQDLTVYGGGYYFFASNTPALGGPRSRVTYDWWLPFGESKWASIFEKITFESAVQYDAQRGTQWYVGARLRVGLGSDIKSMTRMQRKMTDYISRDFDIVSSKKNDWQQATQDGKAVTVAGVTDEAGLEHAIDKNATVIAVNGDITLADTSEKNYLLKDGQTLTGHYYQLTDGSLVSVANGSGVLRGAPDETSGSLLMVGQDNTVRDLSLTHHILLSNNTDAILQPGQSVGKMTIDKVAFDNSLLSVIVGDGSTNSEIYINNNTFTSDNTFVSDVGFVNIVATNDNGATGTALNLAEFNYNTFTQTMPAEFNIGVGALQVLAKANATVNIGDIKSNTINLTSSGIGDLMTGMKFEVVRPVDENETTTMNINGDISDNAITMTGAGVVPTEESLQTSLIGMHFNIRDRLDYIGSGDAAMNIKGNINNNTMTISSSTGAETDVVGSGILLTNQLSMPGTGTSNLIMDGAIDGNHVTFSDLKYDVGIGIGSAVYVENPEAADVKTIATTHIKGGITNNTIVDNQQSVDHIGVFIIAADNAAAASHSSVQIDSLYGNQAASIGMGAGDEEGQPGSAGQSAVTVNVNQGANGVAEANDFTDVPSTQEFDRGTVTVNPGV